MAVAPLKLKRVLPDDFDFPTFQIVWNVNGKNDADTCHLILTGSARTHTAKPRGEIMTLFTVRPNDHQFAGADLFDFCRSACFHSTSRTGASKIRMLTCAATLSAIDRSVRALGASGCAITIGCPISD